MQDIMLPANDIVRSNETMIAAYDSIHKYLPNLLLLASSIHCPP